MDTTTVLRFTSAHADAALIAGVFSLLSLVFGFFVMRRMTACLKDLDEKVALASQQIEELMRVRIVPLGGDA